MIKDELNCTLTDLPRGKLHDVPTKKMSDLTTCHIGIKCCFWNTQCMRGWVPAALTESLLSYPHIDHDPLHDSSNAEKDRKEPVRSQAPFTRDDFQQTSDGFTTIKHSLFSKYTSVHNRSLHRVTLMCPLLVMRESDTAFARFWQGLNETGGDHQKQQMIHYFFMKVNITNAHMSWRNIRCRWAT